MLDRPEDDGVFHISSGDDAATADLRNAYFRRDPKNELCRVLERALGDLGRVCPDCGGLCETQTLALRDAILGRAGHLSARLVEGIKLYSQTREFGITEPSDLISQIYASWNELATLLLVVEPGETLMAPFEGLDQEGDEDEDDNG
jgi:hypothetical protein